MAIPYFYFGSLAKQVDEFILDENSSRHIVQVLRMQQGESLRLTDGKGLSALATIRESNKKRCIVNITEKQIHGASARCVLIAVPPKNTSRFEWFLEKATELGITEIIRIKNCKDGKTTIPDGTYEGNFGAP
jgi:16S rRNA (uracil1498-N3)-methyltransferase